MTTLQRMLDRFSRISALCDVSNDVAQARWRPVVFTDNLDATYYISFHFVFEELGRRKLVQFQVLSKTRVQLFQKRWRDPNDLVERLYAKFRPTIAIFSRYALPSGRELLDAFKRRGIPTIYHLDDDLLELPRSLGERVLKTHGAPEVIAMRTAMLNSADLIYASTARLAERLRDRFSGRRVVCGPIYASYMDFLAARSQTKSKANVTLGYMGSKSHQADLRLAAPAITQIMDMHKQVRLELFGSISPLPGWWSLGKRIKTHTAFGDYRQFISKFCGLGWDVGLAPLERTEFNACKAPTKFIEYSLCGVATVASDIPVYSEFIDGSNGLLASDTESWVVALDTLVRNAEKRRELLEEARYFCKRRFAFDALCDQVQEILTNYSH